MECEVLTFQPPISSYLMEGGRQIVDDGLSAVIGERRKLINLAYRLLGSLADAEDVVQETYARWYTMSEQDQHAIDSPGAWLAKAASRICLDLLRSARVRREHYVGEWIPEPVPDWADSTITADPADRITLDESVNMAFLVVLELMTPAERVAFILHDVFRYPFAEVAEIVGRTPAACRQLAVSARRRIGAAHAPGAATAGNARAVRQFKLAWEAKDMGALMAVLDPGAVAVADGGGLVSAELRPSRGAEQVANVMLGIARRATDLELRERTVNGQPGLVFLHHGGIATVMAFGVANGLITRIWAVRNPDKLRRWTTRHRRQP